MRELPVSAVRDAVRRLFLDINRKIGPDVEAAMRSALEKEVSPAARYALTQLVDNYAAAEETGLPLCQDTGMAICFLTVGQDVHFTGGDLNEAVQQGVREAYAEGYFRKSIVSDPLFERKNTGDNCPAVLHLSMEPGESVRLLGIAKGFGSENMSRIFMLPPAAGEEGVLNAIVTAVREAGPNPCPPIVVGVGIGGGQTGHRPAPGRPSPGPPLRGAGRDGAGPHQPHRHRRGRHRRTDHRPLGQRRIRPHPHRRDAGRRMHLLPRLPSRGNRHLKGKRR